MRLLVQYSVSLRGMSGRIWSSKICHNSF